eukprot:COSAG05_NODE_263_length_12683_cov_5.884218_3_plen_132_part_00
MHLLTSPAARAMQPMTTHKQIIAVGSLSLHGLSSDAHALAHITTVAHEAHAYSELSAEPTGSDMTDPAPLLAGNIQGDGAPARPFPVCRMFSLLAFGFAFGEMMSNFGLIMLPAEGSYMQPRNSAFMLGFL